ncbi:DUF2723 domain-containing protein [Candidatus Woesebacteria bacterium]|nr:DUF2723 domain-containing protein [Candidatus Woesebacteria bacterium]
MKNIITSIVFVIILWAITLFTYTYMASEYVAPGDSTEMVTAAITKGIAHQPGYPLNTLIGNLFYKLPLPFRDVKRVNLASSFISAATVVVFFLALCSLLKDESDEQSINEKLAAFTGSLFLAFSTIFWQYSLKFEVFPLNNLFAVLIILLSVSYVKARDTHSRSSTLFLYILAFISALSLTHHQTIVLIFPGIAILLWNALRKGWDEKSLDLSYLAVFVLGIIPFFVLTIGISSSRPPMNDGMVESVWDAFNNLRRTDFGTFSAFREGLGPQVKSVFPVDHVIYYSRYILSDFSIVGVVFAILGTYYSFRKSKKIFAFILTSFLLSGYVFLGYSQFPLIDAFNQATVRRFHMLPNIFVATAIGYGALFLIEKINQIKSKDLSVRSGIVFANILVVLSVSISVYRNYKYAKAVTTDFTDKYTKNAFGALPKDSLVLLSGDIPGMTSQYYRYVIDKGDSFKAFSPGQFHLRWFNKWLALTYPEVEVPPPYPDKLFTLTSQIVDANYDKGWPFYIGPDIVPNAPLLERDYTLYPRHLLFQAVKKGGDLNTVIWQAENDHIWNTIDLEQVENIRQAYPLFEESIIFHYVRHFYNAGHVYEEVGLYEDAQREYERALEIEPSFGDALVAMSRLYGEKFEQPDYVKAVEYLSRYLNLLSGYTSDDLKEIYEKIDEYKKMYEEDIERAKAEAELETQQATGSGEIEQ